MTSMAVVEKNSTFSSLYQNVEEKEDVVVVVGEEVVEEGEVVELIVVIMEVMVAAVVDDIMKVVHARSRHQNLMKTIFLLCHLKLQLQTKCLVNICMLEDFEKIYVSFFIN